MAPDERSELAVFEEAFLFIVVSELCVRSSRPSGLIDILLINCTFPLAVELVVVVDDDAGLEVAGLNVLQLESKQINTMSMGR